MAAWIQQLGALSTTQTRETTAGKAGEAHWYPLSAQMEQLSRPVLQPFPSFRDSCVQHTFPWRREASVRAVDKGR